LAHLFNLFGADIPTDGYSYFYQAIVLSGNILYGGLGLLFVYRFVRGFANPHVALVSIFLITLTGNLIYYLTAEPSMAHALSLFASGLFFYVWLKRRDQPGLKSAALYGLLGGMMALIRQQDGLFLALPFLAQIPDVWRHLTGRTPGYAWWRWLRDGIVAGVVALLVFSPQLIVWGILYGDFFHSPYLYTAETPFYWFTPKLGAVLFSAYRGLFTWHPIFLLAVAGLFLVYRNDKTMALVGCCGLIIQWYLISAWHVWYQGDAFGGRMFIVATPIFVLGLAYLIEWAVRRWSWQVVYLIGGLLLAWNFLLAVEYRFDLTIANRPPTWYDLTLRRLTFPLELLNRFRS
jgi:hypothetical protein